MGKAWKNPSKVAESQKKGKLFTKLAREITVAAKTGGGDIEGNPRLKLAVNQARSFSCPKDTIERAIKRGSGEESERVNYEHLVYEGYGPHQVGVIVECQTDNKNRTASEVRTVFNKNGGRLGESGSVSWMFEKVCLISGVFSQKESDKDSKANIDIEEEAIEAGAEAVERGDGEEVVFYGLPGDLDSVRKSLTDRGWDIQVAELSYRPKEALSLSEEQTKEVFVLLEALEDNDDSHRVYATCP